VPLEALTDEEIRHVLPREKRTATPAQLVALKSYIAKHGQQWRRKLADAWLIGADAREPNGHLLRQLRNTLGPTIVALQGDRRSETLIGLGKRSRAVDFTYQRLCYFLGSRAA
jgi:hypothetical protein